MYLAEPKVCFSFFFLIFSLKFHQQATFWLFILRFTLFLSEMYSGNEIQPIFVIYSQALELNTMKCLKKKKKKGSWNK